MAVSVDQFNLTAACLCAAVHIPWTCEQYYVPSQNQPLSLQQLSPCYWGALNCSCSCSRGLIYGQYLNLSTPQWPHFLWISCSPCGSPVFRKLQGHSGEKWEVATGVMSRIEEIAEFANHVQASDTADGGMTNWVKPFDGKLLPITL